MGVIIKTVEEIEKMRVAGKLAADVLMMIGEHVKKGVTTDELNTICHNYIVEQQDAIPAPLNYGHPPFPKSICTSCLLYTSPSPRDQRGSRMPSSA